MGIDNRYINPKIVKVSKVFWNKKLKNKTKPKARKIKIVLEIFTCFIA